MNAFLNLFRGFRGHPSHPPMTDASIGAYTAGSLLVIGGWFGLFEDLPMAETGFLAIAVGLLFALPTVITGFADYLLIPRGTGMRRTANFHWVVMASATGAFLVAEALLKKAFDGGEVTGAALGATLAAFGLLTIGGWIGGTIVFEYGMRVTQEDEQTPASKALMPKWPPA
ncbi:MAG: DUF2231 domain-containing protein [Actinomycetota bacterium]